MDIYLKYTGQLRTSFLLYIDTTSTEVFILDKYFRSEDRETPLIQPRKQLPSSSSSSSMASPSPDYVVEDRCNFSVSPTAPPVPCAVTMFSVRFELQHWVREIISRDSGILEETIWGTTSTITAQYRCGFAFLGGATTSIYLSLMDLEVPSLLHQPIIDEIHRASAILLQKEGSKDTADRQPMLFSMAVKISRMTHRVVPECDDVGGGNVDGEDKKQGEEAGMEAESAAEAGDQEGLDIRDGGGCVNSEGEMVMPLSSVGSCFKYGPYRVLKKIRDIAGAAMVDC